MTAHVHLAICYMLMEKVSPEQVLAFSLSRGLLQINAETLPPG